MSMPTVFVSHGSPMLYLEQDLPARAFLASLGSVVPKPKAILAVSAHWNTERPAVSLTAQPETIHDFYGFPEPLYQLHYDAPGAPELARRVADMTGAQPAEYGLDHGAKWLGGAVAPGTEEAALLQPGDQLLDLSWPGQLSLPPDGLLLLEERSADDPYPVRLMGAGAGYWSSDWGIAPFSFGGGPYMKSWRVRVLRPGTPQK